MSETIERNVVLSDGNEEWTETIKVDLSQLGDTVGVQDAIARIVRLRYEECPNIKAVV